MGVDTDAQMMRKYDLDRWASARTMPQLGQVMVAWLTGDVASRPGCRPGAGPPPEIADDDTVRQALIAVNQTGLVTVNAQPATAGYTTTQSPTRSVRVAVAAVQGFVNPPLLDTLIPALAAEGIRHQVWPVRPMWKLFGGHGVPVTFVDGKPASCYGRQMSAKDIKSIFDVCQPAMLTLLTKTQQITIYHPVAGVDELWPVLSQWAFYHR
jgi:hypothetical protein